MKHFIKKHVPTGCFVVSALISLSVFGNAQDRDLRITAIMLLICSISALVWSLKGPDEED